VGHRQLNKKTNLNDLSQIMNILYIDHYAGSSKLGMQFRPYYLSKEWVSQGHYVTIVAASFSHLRTTQPKINKDLSKEVIEGISYLWLQTPSYQTSGLKRVVNILIFVAKLFFFRNRIRKDVNPDVVIVSSTYPLDVYPGYLIAKKSSAKLVFELHDLWPLSPMIIGGYSKYHPFIRLMQNAENFACRHCSCFISLLGNAKQYLMEHGLSPAKFYHIPNGFSFEEMLSEGSPLPLEHMELLEKIRKKSSLIIGYTGGHAPSNALKSFIMASSYFCKIKNIDFVLVGNGSQKKELIQISKKNNQRNIHFLPPIPKTAIPNILSHFDILYAGGVKSRLHSFGTSYNKITDYLLAEKPIIFAVDEPNSLVEKVGCGIQIPAEDEKEIVKSIRLLSEMSCEERTEMGEKGREYALKELNYTNLAKKFIEAINRS
jgi:glycosyltransferase involved in cell wall biosynthesis